MLLVVDDVQAFPAPPVSSALVRNNRRVLVMSTEAVAGFRHTVRIVPESAVAALADGLMSRRDELMPILQKLDPRVGDGSFDLTVEHKIDGTRRTSKLAWQFMFNLGGGHLRLDAALKALAEVPPRDTVLFAIAPRQLATMDQGAEVDWLNTALRQHGVDTGTLPEMLDEIDARISLVRVGTRVSTPHPEVADRIVTGMFFGNDANVRRAFYWDLFDDPSISLGGLAWLAAKAPSYGSDAPEGLLDRLVERCGDAVNHGQAGFLLATLLSLWGLKAARVGLLVGRIRSWISAGVPEHAAGLGRLVNELLNADRSDFLKAGGAPDAEIAAVARDVVCGVSATQVAAWANRIRLDGDGGQAALLERLANAASPHWRREVGALLDRERLAAAVLSARRDQLWFATDLIVSTLLFDQNLARYLVREATPTIVAAMRASVPNGYSAANDIFWRVLGFLPQFLGGRGPDGEQLALAAAILEGVGADVLAAQLSSARRRDWNPWQSISAILSRAAPDLAADVGRKIDLTQIVPKVAAALEDSMYDVDCLLAATVLTEHNEPATRLVREVLVPRRKMNWRAALIAPDAAVKIIKAGGTFPMELKGGLPHWRVAERVLAEIASRDEDAARKLLSANVDALADGLLYRQADGGQGALSFLDRAIKLDEGMVLEAFRRIDVEAARRSWQDRLQGGREEQTTMRAFLTVAKQAGDSVAALAASVEADATGFPELQ